MCEFQSRVYRILSIPYVDADGKKHPLEFIYYRNVTDDYPEKGKGQELNLNIAKTGNFDGDSLDRLIFSCIQGIFGRPLSIKYPCLLQEEEDDFRKRPLIARGTFSIFTINLTITIKGTYYSDKSYQIKCMSLSNLVDLQIPLFKDASMSFRDEKEADAFLNLHIGK